MLDYLEEVTGLMLACERAALGKVFTSRSRNWKRIATAASAKLILTEADDRLWLRDAGAGIGRMGFQGRMMTPSEVSELAAEAPNDDAVGRLMREAADASQGVVLLGTELARGAVELPGVPKDKWEAVRDEGHRLRVERLARQADRADSWSFSDEGIVMTFGGRDCVCLLSGHDKQALSDRLSSKPE